MIDDASDERATAAPDAWERLPPWLAGPARDALAARDRWPQALLIAGAEGVGKRILARHFARALLCEAPLDDGFACGECAGCHYVVAGQHPDLFVAEPVDVDDDGNRTPSDWIRIAAIRRLIEWAQVTSHRHRAKVAIVVPAERMQAAPANALLKTLEEPPPGTHLMLVAHRPGALLPTIVSRCRRLDVARPPADEAVRWLEARRVADAARLLAQAGGAPYAALALADPAHQSERAAWLGALARPETLAPAALAARIDLAGRDERRDRLVAAIDWLLAWTADLARVVAGGRAVQVPERAGELAALASRVARISLFVYHRRLLRQRAWSTHPLQPRLVAEALLIEYRALFPT
jgi:DNA polymerase-3 subunit delta'